MLRRTNLSRTWPGALAARLDLVGIICHVPPTPRTKPRMYTNCGLPRDAPWRRCRSSTPCCPPPRLVDGQATETDSASGRQCARSRRAGRAIATPGTQPDAQASAAYKELLKRIDRRREQMLRADRKIRRKLRDKEFAHRQAALVGRVRLRGKADRLIRPTFGQAANPRWACWSRISLRPPPPISAITWPCTLFAFKANNFATPWRFSPEPSIARCAANSIRWSNNCRKSSARSTTMRLPGSCSSPGWPSLTSAPSPKCCPR